MPPAVWSRTGRPVLGRAHGALIGLLLVCGVAGCSAIPPFPGTGSAPETVPPTARPTLAPNTEATVAAAVKATVDAGARPTVPAPVLPTVSATASVPLAPATVLPLATALTALPELLRPATAGPAPAPAPGSGAPSPQEAVQRAYEAAANGDDQALRAVTDPELRDDNPLRVIRVLSSGDRKLTLSSMRYDVVQNDGSVAVIHVTGRIGNIPLVGERSVDDNHSAKNIGGAWYLARSADEGRSRR
jgi:hypothetical protein